MNRKNANKRPAPSYEEGKLRDPSIAEKQTEPGSRNLLLRLIRRATNKRS